MSSFKPTHIPYGLSDESRRTIINPGVKDYVYFTKYGIETNGAYFSVRCLVKGGGGVPIHRHASYTETIRAVSGTLGIVCENGMKTKLLEPGEEVTIPKNEWHRFFNPSPDSDIEFDGVVTPHHQEFEQNLHIFYGLAQDGLSTDEGLPKSFVHMCLCMHMAEITYPGVGMWFFAMISVIVAKYATWTGEKERLIRKYYGQPVAEDSTKKQK